MEFNGTKGKWSLGKSKSTVVSTEKVQLNTFPSPPNPKESDDSDLNYYGGYLIAESIGNDKDATLIAQAPAFFNFIKKCIEENRFKSGETEMEAHKLLKSALV